MLKHRTHFLPNVDIVKQQNNKHAATQCKTVLTCETALTPPPVHLRGCFVRRPDRSRMLFSPLSRFLVSPLAWIMKDIHLVYLSIQYLLLVRCIWGLLIITALQAQHFPLWYSSSLLMFDEYHNKELGGSGERGSTCATVIVFFYPHHTSPPLLMFIASPPTSRFLPRDSLLFRDSPFLSLKVNLGKIELGKRK